MSEQNSHADRLVKLSEVAKTFGCSTDTVRRMITSGRLAAVVVAGTRYMVRESALRAAIRDVEPRPLADGDVIVVDRRAA